MAIERYKTPPKRAFRAMGLGVLCGEHIKVVAGFRFKWWLPDFRGPIEPLYVNARVLRIKPAGPKPKEVS